MKKGSKTKWNFYLAAVLVLLAGPAMGAGLLCDGEVTGTVVEITTDVPPHIVVDPGDESADLEFTGIPVEYLENFLAIECDAPELTLFGARIKISYHECPGRDTADAVLKACSIAIIAVTGCDADATADADAIVTFELPVRPRQAYRVPPVPAAPKGSPGGASGGPGYGRRGPSN
jgi:hypothetical protein